MAAKKPKDIYVVGRTLPNPNSPNIHSRPDQLTPNTAGKKRPKLWARAMVAILLLLLVPVLVIGIWDLSNYSKASKKVFGTGNLLNAIVPGSIGHEGSDRVNVMVVGFSADDPGHAGANLTDSIMIVSLSKANKRGYMLSIPRDLYVSIPEYGHAKINEAYQAGELNEFNEPGLPHGGMGLLEKTIRQSVGIKVDYYLLVNYAAVRETTDALGGITVNIESNDPRGIYDPNFKPHEGGPLRLPNGQQHINGLSALRLARARGAAGGYGLAQSDFDRTKNQQAVILGIKNALNMEFLLNPTKNFKLLDGIANNVSTDLELNQVIPLYKLFSGIPTDDLKSVSLRDINGQNLLAGYTTPYGQSALIPASGIGDFSDIKIAIEKLNN